MIRLAIYLLENKNFSVNFYFWLCEKIVLFCDYKILNIPFIDHDDPKKSAIQKMQVYNIAGQRLAHPQRGINLIEGRKFVIK